MKEKKIKYVEICNYFKEKIENGQIIPGEKLPIEYDIVKKFSVSRHTVRLALSELEKDGYIYREKGRGAFCSNISKERKEKPRMVMIITTYLSAYIFPYIIRGIEEILSKNGYEVLLFSTNNKKEKEAEHLNKLLNYNIVGAIIEPTASATENTNIDYYLNLEKRQIPYIMINASYKNLNSSYIIMDDEKVGYLLCKHLIDSGHREIAGIFKEDDIQGRNRRTGYENALKEADIKVQDNCIGSFKTFEEEFYPYAFTRNILSQENRPSAIVCYNDKIALQVINAVRDLNFKVPQDISVVGCDNDETIANIINGGLTTVNHPKEELGKLAAEELIKMIEKKEKEFKFVYEPQLIIKNSTKSK